MMHVRRLAAMLTALALGAGCKQASKSAPAEASSAAPAIATSWQQDPGKLLDVGDAAPDFEAIAHNGEKVKLSRYLEKPVVVYFYPKDGTPGCTMEAQQIRDVWLSINQRVGMVFGVSTDDNVSHREFASEHELPFLLLSDADTMVAKAFGVPIENGVAKRVTFVIGADGKIVRVFPDVEPDGHAREIMTVLDELEG